jgi:hypothetical protein
MKSFSEDKHCLDVCAASLDEFQNGGLSLSSRATSLNEVCGEGGVAGISVDDFKIPYSSEKRLSTRCRK